jgi:release factor glutamine methyltransferase
MKETREKDALPQPDGLVEDLRQVLSSSQASEDWDADVAVADPEKEARAIVERAQQLALESSGNVERIARELAERRASGALLGRVIGRVHFCGLEIATAPDCLVPRSDTAVLAAGATEVLSAMGSPRPVVVDMCCGVGNLACALATAFPAARVYACDLTDACVNAASANVRRLGLADRVEVRQGDLFGSLGGLSLEGTIDLVVCNPPYMSTGRLQAARSKLLEQEPREAFDGGPYGMQIHQRAIVEGAPFVRLGGWIGFEFGIGQDRQIKLLFQRYGRLFEDPVLKADQRGATRAALAQRRAPESA